MKAPSTRQWRCTDCTATAESTHLTHEDTCPVGLDLDETSAADRDWFRDHPGQEIYRRAPSFGEKATILACLDEPPPDGAKWRGHVEVTRISDWARLKNFTNVYIVAPRRPR